MCGKEIEDNSAFCTWCGAKLDPLPEQEKVPEAVGAAAVQGQGAGQAPQAGAPAGQTSSVQYGRSDGIQFTGTAQAPQAQPASEDKPGTVFGAEVPIKDAPEAADKPRKYYTGVHIALCLATTGIMAMAAGVFAALYFSAIL